MRTLADWCYLCGAGAALAAAVVAIVVVTAKELQNHRAGGYW